MTDMRDPDKKRETDRRSRQRNPEKNREAARRWRERNPDWERKWSATNPFRRHGLRPAEVAAMFAEQEGCCYLCEQPMAFEDIHIDHDHRCCPRGTSCPVCRRGLAHAQCNTAIGLLHDDPEKLRRVADNLEVAIARATIRLHEKPVQLSLIEEEGAA